MNGRIRQLTVSTLTAALALSCSRGAPPPATSVTPAATAASATASPTPPAPAAQSAVLPLATGAIPASVTQVIAAMVNRQSDRLNSLVTYQQVACTKALGAGGPPKCKPGDAEGTVYRVFPAGRCEPEWVEDARTVLSQIVASAGPLYAAATIAPKGPVPDPNWPKGEAVVLFRAGANGAPAAYFIVDASNILRAHLACDAGAGREDDEIKRLGGTAFLIAPAAR